MSVKRFKFFGAPNHRLEVGGDVFHAGDEFDMEESLAAGLLNVAMVGKAFKTKEPETAPDPPEDLDVAASTPEEPADEPIPPEPQGIVGSVPEDAEEEDAPPKHKPRRRKTT